MGKYISQYKQMDYVGDMTIHHIDHIKELIELTNSKTLLDFGCGGGQQYKDPVNLQKDLGMMPSLYDPGVDAYEKLPWGIFDGVYSTDVMEHIPKDELPAALEIIFYKAKKFVFLAICTAPAFRRLPNGENAHCTVETISFWKDIVEQYRPSNILTHIKTYGPTSIGGLCNSYEILKDK